MNQTLQNTKLAGAITGMALLCGLLLAEPVPHRAQSGPAVFAAGGQAVAELRRDLARDLARDLELRARRLEADMAATGPAGEALAIASAAVATSVVDTTLSALLDDFRPPAGAGAPVLPDANAAPETAIRSRSAMAMPYFATASGQNRGIGE